MAVQATYDEILEHGIDLFNSGKYAEAHDAWEHLWLDAQGQQDKQFLQGLIMTADAFLHYRNRECAGASMLLAKSGKLLESGIYSHPEIRLADFIRALAGLGTTFDNCLFEVTPDELPRISTYGRPFVQRQVY